jgi:hypothetical protein
MPYKVLGSLFAGFVLLVSVAVAASWPDIIIDNPSDIEPAGGEYFVSTLATLGEIGQNYKLIIDDDGSLVYGEEILPPGATANDFKAHSPLGPISNRDGDCISVYDLGVNEIDRFCVGGDYVGERVDFHDFLIDSQGDGWLMLYRNEPADLTPYGGPVSGTIEMSVIQQIDNDSGAVKWQIRADDWLTLNDATLPLTRAFVQPSHANSFDLCDEETTIIISSRSVDEVIKMRLADKAVLWRLGGKNATVAPSDGVEIRRQHDARCIDDGNLISIFDNGDIDLRPYSRAVVYQIDPVSNAAALIYEYRHNPDFFARFTGNFQYLVLEDRGVVHWGSVAFDDPELPNLTEVRLSDNAVVQELYLPGNTIAYRITKSKRYGNKLYLPYVAVAEASQ